MGWLETVAMWISKTSIFAKIIKCISIDLDPCSQNKVSGDFVSASGPVSASKALWAIYRAASEAALQDIL